MPKVQKRPVCKVRKRPCRPPSHSGRHVGKIKKLQSLLTAARQETTQWADIARSAQAESEELRRTLATHAAAEAEQQRTREVVADTAASDIRDTGCGESLAGDLFDCRDLRPPPSWLTGQTLPLRRA
mgnify:FL=1